MRSFFTSKNTKILLVLMHITGVLGLSNPKTSVFFEYLVPFNLLATTFFLIYFQENKSNTFVYFCFLVGILGYFVEVVGVNTGLVFGQYTYQNALGFKIFQTPLLIGCNWLVMVYTGGYMVHKIPVHWVLRAFFASTILTIQDFFIEPVAISYHFWFWKEGIPPLQNYVAWFLVAFVFELVFFGIKFRKKNTIASTIFYCQMFFFVAHFFLLKIL